MKSVCKYVVCIFAFVILLMFAACGAAEYSVKDFADISVVGYTEHGSLSIKVKEEAINRIYADGTKDKTAALRFADTFRFSYEGQNDEDSYFTNGDVVTVNVSYDESMARALGISFVDSSFDYTIEGLEDKLETSPFEGLSVKFSGVAPYGTVQIDKSNCIQYVIDNVTFICDNHDLSNGDKVVVKAEFNAEIAERNGYVFTEDVKKFTVVGLSKYVNSMLGVTYSPITAKMRYMVEQFVGGTETSYKTFNWFFGDEDSDTDSDGYIDLPDTDEDEQNAAPEEIDSADGEEDDTGNTASDNTSNTSSRKREKRKTDIQKLKEDFVLSNFRAEFDYEPVECYYSLNPLQYSDNMFYSVYKVTGKFVCEDTSGSGYIKPGDTVVGEIYVTATLTGGSVDIKNNLVYEDNVLTNQHSYSIRSYPEYEDMTDEVFKSTSYVVEKLDYVEDSDAYDKFVKTLENKGTYSKPDIAHINVSSESDSDSDKNSDTDSQSDSDLSEDLGGVQGSGDDSGVYYDVDDGENDGENYDDDYAQGYDYSYEDDY